MPHNIVLLNAHNGFDTKIRGPRCLAKLAGNTTVLHRMQKIVPGNYYHSLGQDCEVILKSGEIKKSYIINDKFEECGPLENLKNTIREFELTQCFVMSGNIVFSESVSLFPEKNSTVYTKQNFDKNKVGVSHINNYLQYMTWGLSPSWAEILYINEELIQFLLNKTNSKRYKYAFLSEAINLAAAAKYPIMVKSLNSDVIDINRNGDIARANIQFNIS